MPLPLSDQIVPLWDEVAERAAGPLCHVLVAEGGATVHAAARLCLHLLHVLLGQDFLEVADSLLGASLGQVRSLELDKAAGALGNQSHILHLLWPGALLEDCGHILHIETSCRVNRCFAPAAASGELPDITEFAWQIVLDAAQHSVALLVCSHHSGHELLGEASGELRSSCWPLLQQLCGQLAVSVVPVCLQQLLQVVQLIWIRIMGLGWVNAGDLQGVRKDLLLELVLWVPDPDHAAAHASSEVVAHRAKDRNPATSHVLAAVITGTLHNGPCSGVSDCKPLSGDATHQGETRSGSVQCGVANDDVLVGLEA
mmetsp:Transcript_14150/g.33364  ORF Transcript_14150/g.33364 Transcript_14150/m.33364 type:complete len:313 (-) Transcript_14150:4226-5164(-)